MAVVDFGVCRKVFDEELSTGCTRWVAPVVEHFAGDGEPSADFRAGGLEAHEGGELGLLRHGAARIGNYVNFVPGIEGGEGGEDDADIGGDAGHDDLLAAGFLDGFYEVGVLPRVDLAGTLDDGRIGEERDHLGEFGTVGAIIRAGGDDGGDVVDLGELGQADHEVFVFDGGGVVDEVHQTGLVVDEGKDGVFSGPAFAFAARSPGFGGSDGGLSVGGDGVHVAHEKCAADGTQRKK